MSRYGLFGSLNAVPGQRDALLEVLMDGLPLVAEAPGCEMYFFSVSPDDADAIWITEVWRSEADHNASLQDERIREIITRAMPLVAGMGNRVVLEPLAGKGLARAYRGSHAGHER